MLQNTKAEAVATPLAISEEPTRGLNRKLLERLANKGEKRIEPGGACALVGHEQTRLSQHPFSPWRDARAACGRSCSRGFSRPGNSLEFQLRVQEQWSRHAPYLRARDEWLAGNAAPANKFRLLLVSGHSAGQHNHKQCCGPSAYGPTGGRPFWNCHSKKVRITRAPMRT